MTLVADVHSGCVQSVIITILCVLFLTAVQNSSIPFEEVADLGLVLLVTEPAVMTWCVGRVALTVLR